ncbi:MAG TPA: orotidine-5'-phosphate decarboxylase [Deltaproteobacteria bacterium]|nr:orotidine-5'-phosphate decarboxylase [Deltaproteobacteria bacterium]
MSVNKNKSKVSPLIVALDVASRKDVEKILDRLGTAVDFYKIGLRLFIHYGPDIVAYVKRRRKKVFLDLKLHDIPNTVAEACREAVRLKVDMLTLHAGGGAEMMRAAADAVLEESQKKKIPAPALMGVTVLTSMDSLEELGLAVSPAKQVLRLAKLARESGLDGVICSPHEIQMLRAALGRDFKIVTPGVRPAGSELGDQKRVKTPEQAFALGADAVVMGRPILQALFTSPSPVKVSAKAIP